MTRITEFQHNGKNIVQFDLSNIKTNEELAQVILESKNIMSGYQPCSVYTIADISRITFDTKTKELAADWMKSNEAYVKKSVVVGATGVRKIMMKAVIKLSGRDNTVNLPDASAALEWFDREE